MLVLLQNFHSTKPLNICEKSACLSQTRVIRGSVLFGWVCEIHGAQHVSLLLCSFMRIWLCFSSPGANRTTWIERSDPECFSRSVIWINVQHTFIKSHLIYTSICTKIKLHTTSSLREDTSFTQKWNEIYLFSFILYVVILRTLMQLVSIQSSKKGQKHHWSTKIVVHMSCALYEVFWRHTIALYEEQTEILLFIENVSQALECHSSFHIWIFCAVFDCDKCQNLAQGFSAVKPGSLFLNVCAKQIWMLRQWDIFSE